MTDEQRDMLIAKIVDSPSSLTEKELDAMLHDDDLKDIYEMSAAVSSACICQPEPDVEAEWERFRPRLRRKPTPMKWVMRVAAIFLGVMLASGIAVKIINKVFTPKETAIIAKTETTVAEEPLSVEPIPKEAAAEVVAVKVKKRTTVKVKPREQNEMDIDEYLRIQQARIDNDIAMQNAAVYEDEYNNLMAILDIIGGRDDELENEIRKVTIE